MLDNNLSVSTNKGSSYVSQYTNRFVYRGWNLVAILDGCDNLVYSFRWGIDASGTQQGAGGVGGLISMTAHVGSLAGVYFYAFDGNQNVVALVNAADGTIAAQYEYGQFGQLIRATGPLAFINPFRFSTKFQDDETGFVYFGYRYYSTATGRWLSRDPIGESGGINRYCTARNDLLSQIDGLGLASVEFVAPSPFTSEIQTAIADALNCAISTAKQRAEEAGKFANAVEAKLMEAQESPGPLRIKRCIELYKDLARALRYAQMILGEVGSFDNDKFIIDFDSHPPSENPDDVLAYVWSDLPDLNNPRSRAIFLANDHPTASTFLHETVHLTKLDMLKDNHKIPTSLFEAVQTAYFYNTLGDSDTVNLGTGVGTLAPSGVFGAFSSSLEKFYGGLNDDKTYYRCCNVFSIFHPGFPEQK